MSEEELIVLVDDDGNPVGSTEKYSSHHANTPLHLAFSCYVFDERGRFLATRRSLHKKVWPGVWSNSVCGHPAPGEPMVAAIERRLHYELGMSARDFQVVLPRHKYRAPPFQGVVEHEFCPVFVAVATGEPRPNRLEVDTFAWVRWGDFVQAAQADSDDAYSWWCKNQLKELTQQGVTATLAPTTTNGGRRDADVVRRVSATAGR
jgi:isopentenyl-diphosphate delta-isomerase